MFDEPFEDGRDEADEVIAVGLVEIGNEFEKLGFDLRRDLSRDLASKRGDECRPPLKWTPPQSGRAEISVGKYE